ncbi:MAG: 2-oxoacid:acceptor oxidoreductase family protein [archaeon]
MKLVITGKGGDGVKFLGTVLSKVLMRKYNVVVSFDYDAANVGGDIISYIIYSEEKIGNVTIDKADVLFRLNKVGKEIKFDREVVVVDSEYRKNMVGLGVILKSLNIGLDIELLRSLITKDTGENIKSVEYGYSL